LLNSWPFIALDAVGALVSNGNTTGLIDALAEQIEEEMQAKVEHVAGEWNIPVHFSH